MGKEEASYRIHENLYNNSDGQKELNLYRNWFNQNTTDLWRHKRMLSVLDSFLETDKNAAWLTVGDGRFGTSAIYINQNGGKATATDIDTKLLEIARSNGMLDLIAYANAEKLPFHDDAFDYAYCKQSYHHFPRPILAVYEMLRVSKKAIVFTEPHDFYPPPPLRAVLQKIKHWLKRITGKTIPHHDTGNYEPVGNYIYGISVREFEKIALGMGFPAIAYKLYHDAYVAGVEQETFSEQAPLYKKLQAEIRKVALQHRIGLNRPNNIQMILFKAQPDAALVEKLKAGAYKLVFFSPNPYI